MITPLYEDRLSKIEDLLYRAREVCMAVSFVKVSGIALIRPIYIQGNRTIKLIVDTKQNITEKAALKQLLNDHVQIKRYSNSGAYHPKVWLFQINDAWVSVVGSMNVSLGALNSNVEYCLLIEGEDVTQIKSWFDNLWAGNATTSVDMTFVETMPSYSKTTLSQISPQNLQVHLDYSSLSTNEIKRFVDDWVDDTIREGQAQRKLGWRFRPAHGPIDNTRLLELKKVVIYMFPSDVPFRLTDSSATSIISNCNIQFSRSDHVTSDRDRIVRIHLNYLEKLGLVKKGVSRGWVTVHITSIGKAFKITDDVQLISFAEKTLIEYIWFGVPIYDFICELLSILPDHKVNKKEMQIFVRHGGISEYSQSTPEDITKLILVYRILSNAQKDAIWTYMEQRFVQTDTSQSRTSFMNMVGNGLNDIMEDLAITSQLKLENNELKLVE